LKNIVNVASDRNERIYILTELHFCSDTKSNQCCIIFGLWWVWILVQKLAIQTAFLLFWGSPSRKMLKQYLATGRRPLPFAPVRIY